MAKLLMLKGLVASGKSTFAKELVEKGWVRVNKDDLRAMMHNSHHGKSKEKQIILARNHIIRVSLGDKMNCVVDDTNFNPIHEKELSQIAASYGADFEVKFFDVPLEECIARDAKRERPVGEMVIRDMYNKYIAKEVVSEEYVPNQNLPAAYIFDIDGTLAKMGARSPYEWDKVYLDTVMVPVARVLALLEATGVNIIVLSGRDGSCRNLTEHWLKINSIPYQQFFMREAGCKRKDSDIKKEIFFRDIAPHYNVLGVFDDRNQVVKMWRELGLTCFQVADGDF